MASKNCPHCSKQVPVACKKCGCGHVFFTSRRTAASICRDTAAAAASSSEPPVADDIQDNPGEGSNQPTRRSGRVTRERPNFYDALEYENQTRRGNNADGAFRKVLVTVGTTQFDDLVDMIFHPSTLETFHGWGVDSVSLQVGSSSFNKLGQFHTNGIHFNAVKYLPKLGDEMAKADLIICHGGAGTTMEALELGKPVIVVPNRKLMDDHQLELAGKLEEGGHVVLTSVDTFNEDQKQLLRKQSKIKLDDPEEGADGVDGDGGNGIGSTPEVATVKEASSTSRGVVGGPPPPKKRRGRPPGITGRKTTHGYKIHNNNVKPGTIKVSQLIASLDNNPDEVIGKPELEIMDVYDLVDTGDSIYPSIKLKPNVFVARVFNSPRKKPSVYNNSQFTN